MDKQFILNTTDIYNNIEKNKRNIKAFELGLNFFDFLFKELNDIEKLSEKEINKKSMQLKVFNFKKGIYCIYNVNYNSFQSYLQFSYRQFIEDNYLIHFSWYKKFHFFLQKKLETDFEYTSANAINFIIRLLSDCFIFFSNGNNCYDYKVFTDFFYEKLITIGLDKEHSRLMSLDLINILFDEKLLYNEKPFFPIKKKFKLSDDFMDIVFNLNSLFIAQVCFEEEQDQIKFNPKYELRNLSESIYKYNSIWDNMNSYSQIKVLLEKKYPILLKELLDDSILNINPKLLEKLPKHLLDSVRVFFFRKILLNEYYFQLVIISCFDSYSLKKISKNVLHDYKNFFYV